VGVAGEKLKESEREQQAEVEVEAEAQAPPTPTIMPLLQLGRKKFVTRGIVVNLRFRHLEIYLRCDN
jgi:hypothetical protein